MGRKRLAPASRPFFRSASPLLAVHGQDFPWGRVEVPYYRLIILEEGIIPIGKANQRLIKNRLVIKSGQAVTGVRNHIFLNDMLKEQGRIFLEPFFV